jgi:hypothetical protein
MLSLLTDRRHKNSRLGYYLKNLWLASLPDWWHRREGRRLLALAGSPLRSDWSKRLEYYARLPERFELGSDAVRLGPQMFEDRRNYAFDLARPMRRVDPTAHFHCRFGDQTEPPERPTFVKARRVDETSGHSVLLKLNRIRHFVRASDRTAWADKRPTAVWRGNVNRPNRARSTATLDRGTTAAPLHRVARRKRRRDEPQVDPELELAVSHAAADEGDVVHGGALGARCALHRVAR